MSENQTAGVEALLADGNGAKFLQEAGKRELPLEVRLTFNDGHEEVRTVMSDFRRWTLLKMMSEYKGVATVTPVDPAFKVV